MPGQRIPIAAAIIIMATAVIAGTQTRDPVAHGDAATSIPSSTLNDAQRLFYNARYAEAASTAQCGSGSDAVASCELRSAALLFQLKRALPESGARKKDAWKQCVTCPALLAEFQATIARGQALARERLLTDPTDEATLVLLGKLDLNHVWLHLGTLGRKTGWNEYWEARRTLDHVLERNPRNVRARVARAWIDYIVDTKMPRGTRWLLGGGNKKRGLLAVREAAAMDGDFFVQAEARFALWDMLVRERNFAEALVMAHALARDFPTNPELDLFIRTQESAAAR